MAWYDKRGLEGDVWGLWHFLFDLDGTILDTTELIMTSFIHTFHEGLGEDVTREELMVHFGRPLEEQFETMRPQLSEDAIARLVNIYREHNEFEHDRFVSVVPGADRGLRTLAEAGFPLGIVTSKRLALTVQGLKQFGLYELFQVVVHSDSTKNHKPHPEPVEHAMALMGGKPGEAAYVGDSPYDMAAGRAAGVRTLGLVYNTFSEATLREAGADRIVQGWPDIVDTLLDWANRPHKTS